MYQSLLKLEFWMGIFITWVIYYTYKKYIKNKIIKRCYKCNSKTNIRNIGTNNKPICFECWFNEGFDNVSKK